MPQDDASFRRWYAEQSRKYQLNPDPDAPEQLYDYRGAFKAGATPDASGHWPSQFKKAGHPNEIVGGFNTRTGERVPGTRQASESELVSLGWDPAAAKRMSQQQTLAQMVRAKYPGAYDDLSDQDLEKSVRSKYPGVYDDLPSTPTKTETKKPSGASGDYGTLATIGDFVKDLAIGGFKGAGSTALNLAKVGNPAIGAVAPAVEAVYGPKLTASNTPQAIGKTVEQIGEAFVPAGEIAKGAQVLASQGPKAVKWLTRAAAEGLGQAGIATAQGNDPVVAGVAGGALGAAGGAIKSARAAMVNPNPVERAALEYVESRGVPVDAATMTGNSALKGAKYLADRSLAGSVVAGRGAQQEAKGLKNLGEQLASKAQKTAATPLSAGDAVRSAVSKRITALHDEATQHYEALRLMEEANMQRVITGTGPSRTGVVRAVTQTETMGFPVQLKPVKEALKPIYERIKRQMPLTQQQASYGFKALDNIVNGPNIAPASVVDADLSAIKAIVRQADRPELRDLSQGLAASAVKQLDDAVQRAVSAGGPKATAALQAGRQATKAKYLTADILDNLREEPVRAFNQATAPRDSAISQLRELASVAPKEIPKLGRAYLDDLIGTATSEGGFKGAAGIARKWETLGPQTKKILFPKAGHVEELNKFFLAAKRLAENPNPSGSGGMVSIGAQGGLLVFDPLVGLGTQALGGLTSTVLRSPRAVRLLTEGLTSRGKVTAAALKQAVLHALSEKDDQ